ncbi:hydroxymethylpyrimidine pyrophosphatase-like HAD family hydrolase [Streptomyces sp. BK205]|nr:hydroxymethylpyrimidine pyrophosphatase-like HAD family hydrolase [Streptomyces sp. BK205]
MRYAVFDLDGTLIGPDGRPYDRMVNAIAGLGDRGIVPILATGRSRDGLTALTEAASLVSLFDDEILLSNGDALFHRVAGRLRCDRTIPADVIPRLLAEGIKDLVFEYEGAHIALSRRAGMAYAVAFGRKRRDIDVWTADAPAPSPTSVTVLGATAHRDPGRLTALLSGLNCTLYPLEAFQAVVVHSAETCKATALAAHLRSRFTEPGLERVMAFGNGDNDVTLVSRSGIGVAVQDSTPAARASAKVNLHGPLADFLASDDFTALLTHGA